MRQTADKVDYWREANSLNSVCDWANGTALGVAEMVDVVKLRQTKTLSKSDDHDRRRNVYNTEFSVFFRACRYA